MALDLTQYQNEDRRPLDAAPAGEYEIALLKFKKDEDGGIVLFSERDGVERRYIMPMFEIVNHPDADSFKEFTHYLELPGDHLTGKEKRRKLAELEAFGQAFGFDLFAGEVNEEDLIGNTAAAVLIYQETEEFGNQNRIKQFLVFK